MIKGILLDLDNTLFDFMTMKRVAVEEAVDCMLDNGLSISKQRMIESIYEVYFNKGIESQEIFHDVLKREFKVVDHKLLAAGIVGYRRGRQKSLQLYKIGRAHV